MSYTEGVTEGADGRDINCRLLAACVGRRAEWTADDGYNYRFFGYEPKRTRAATLRSMDGDRPS